MPDKAGLWSAGQAASGCSMPSAPGSLRPFPASLFLPFLILLLTGAPLSACPPLDQPQSSCGSCPKGLVPASSGRGHIMPTSVPSASPDITKEHVVSTALHMGKGRSEPERCRAAAFPIWVSIQRNTVQHPTLPHQGSQTSSASPLPEIGALWPHYLECIVHICVDGSRAGQFPVSQTRGLSPLEDAGH